MSGSINWTKVLGELGLESPGREEAVRLAIEDTKARYLVHPKKRAKGTSSRKVNQVSRKGLQAAERRNKFPSLKHGAD